MLEYALLILGIGLVVYNSGKIMIFAFDRIASSMAAREVEVMRSLDKENDNEKEKTIS